MENIQNISELQSFKIVEILYDYFSLKDSLKITKFQTEFNKLAKIQIIHNKGVQYIDDSISTLILSIYGYLNKLTITNLTCEEVLAYTTLINKNCYKLTKLLTSFCKKVYNIDEHDSIAIQITKLIDKIKDLEKIYQDYEQILVKSL